MGHASDISRWDIDPLPTVQRNGLTAIAVVASFSVISTITLFTFLSYRMIFWRSNYARPIGYNQYVVLIYNLILADLQQSIAFILNVRWVVQKKIPASSSVCYAQGLLLQIGDPASGLFVFAISLHTFLLVFMRHKLRYKAFVSCVTGLWVFIGLLAILPPALYGRRAFVPSGAWCWISSDYEPCRLWLHYIWIFVSEFGTVCLYAVVVIQLRRKIAESSILGAVHHHENLKRLRRVVSYMVLYPIAYLILSLPLAAGRMATMQGNPPNVAYFCVAGAIMTSSGMVDVFLYALTRRKLLVDSESSHNNKTKTKNNKKNTLNYNDSNSKLVAVTTSPYGHNLDLTNHTIITAGGGGGGGESKSKLKSKSKSKNPADATITTISSINDTKLFLEEAEIDDNHYNEDGDGTIPVQRSSPREGSMEDIVPKRDSDIELLPFGRVYQETTIEVTTEPAPTYSPYPGEFNGRPRVPLDRLELEDRRRLSPLGNSVEVVDDVDDYEDHDGRRRRR